MTATENQDQENDDMTAATVEQDPITEDEQVGENEPRRVEVPTVAERIDPKQELEPSGEFKARIARMMQDVAHPDVEDEPLPADDLAARRRETYERAWRNSLIDANVTDLATWALGDLGPDQHGAILSQFVANIGPDAAYLNMICGGRVGSGKTSAAIAAGNEGVKRGLLVRFIQHATYLRWLRPDGAPRNMPDWQVRKRFRDCDLLILDALAAGLDLGEPATKFVRDETTALIGDRIDSGKATILTTNVRPEDLEVMIDERLVSRLSKRGYALRFAGEDHRGRLSW